MRFAYVCDVECEAHGQVSLDRITNLSVTGAWIETLDPPAEGLLLNLRFSAGSIEIRTQAKVIRRQPGKGMGVAFRNLLPYYRNAIDALAVDASHEAEHSDQMIR
jgi:hypothetical protein